MNSGGSLNFLRPVQVQMTPRIISLFVVFRSLHAVTLVWALDDGSNISIIAQIMAFYTSLFSIALRIIFISR